MSFDIVCCNQKIEIGDLWFLSDIKGFTARKLYIGTCKKCDEEYAVLIETRVSDNKTFVNKLKGIEAVKTMYREKKRKLMTFPRIKSSNLYGWIYGHNVQIRNKKGKVTQIRQYSSDFYGQKELTKSLFA